MWVSRRVDGLKLWWMGRWVEGVVGLLEGVFMGMDGLMVDWKGGWVEGVGGMFHLCGWVDAVGGLCEWMG